MLGVIFGFTFMLAVINFGLINIFKLYPILQKGLILTGTIFLIYLSYKISFSKSSSESDNLKPVNFVETFLSLTYDQDIDQLVDDAFFDSSFSSRSGDPKKKFKGDRYGKCATIEFDEINNIKTISFDGECEGKNGQIRKGQMLIFMSRFKTY